LSSLFLSNLDQSVKKKKKKIALEPQLNQSDMEHGGVPFEVHALQINFSRFSLTEALESVRGCFKEVKPFLLADIVVGNNK